MRRFPGLSAQEWIQNVQPGPVEDQRVYKRPAYLSHKDHLQQIEWVFVALSKPPVLVPHGVMKQISVNTGIPDSTLRRWRNKLQLRPNWRPTREIYRQTNRTFTDEEEAQLLSEIQENYIDKGLYYCDEDFKIDALRFWESRASALDRNVPEHNIRAFLCSAPFIEGFRERHRMSLRRPNLKRRPAASEEQVQLFINRIQELMQRYPHNRIINIDETNWRTVAAGFLTWAVKGSESVSVHINNDDKEGVTVIAGIDATGEKLPLTVIGKGKTKRCLAGFHLPGEVWGQISESGWTTSDVMVEYLLKLRQEVFPDGPILLILDTYAAHRSASVRAIAETLHIDLIFIPPGCTDRLQPLDRKVFGILKAHARQIWRKHYHLTHGEKVTRAMIAERLVEAWKRIPSDITQSAWEIFDSVWAGGEPADDERSDLDDGEYQQLISVHDAMDM